jgi:tripartite-type tricarboxylate transporter receptor subunit TctC
MKKLSLLFLVVFFAGSLVPVREAAAAPYFQGKVITIIVAFSPGGGYDRISRLLAKHIPKYIPGNPTVIVQNMPGASSILATNYLYKVAKPDGLTIGTFERGLPLVQLLKVEGAKFDLRKFAWIGSMAVEATIMALRTDLPFKDFNDVLQAKKPIMLGRTGPGDNTAQLAFLLQEFAGLKMTLISYPSSPEIMLAIERKELDGRGGSYSALKPDIERGLVRPFIRSRVSEPGIENLPVDEDLVKDPKGKTIMALRSSSEQVGRPYVAPPGTPAPVMKILQNAFARAAADPELQAEAKKLRLKVDYLPAQDCLKVINFVLNQPESMVQEFSRYIKF